MGIAAGIKDITQDIASSYEARIAEVGRLKTEAKEMLSYFHASHGEMSSGLRRGLAQAKAKMGTEVRTMRNGFQTSHKEMGLALGQDLAEHTQSVRGKVAKMRQEIGASHRDMSTKLRKDLTQGVRAGKSEVKAMRNGFRTAHNKMGTQLRKDLASYDRSIKSAVSGIRQEMIADLREARTTWQELASNMQAKRGGVVVPEYEIKMLAAIDEHPEGMTLAGIADSLGVAPIVLGRAVKSLMDKGEIRKEEKLYFPAGAE